MKKTYIKPAMEVIELSLEGIIAGSINMNVSEEHTVESDGQILSNSERGGGIWGD